MVISSARRKEKQAEVKMMLNTLGVVCEPKLSKVKKFEFFLNENVRRYLNIPPKSTILTILFYLLDRTEHTRAFPAMPRSSMKSPSVMRCSSLNVSWTT